MKGKRIVAHNLRRHVNRARFVKRRNWTGVDSLLLRNELTAFIESQVGDDVVVLVLSTLQLLLMHHLGENQADFLLLQRLEVLLLNGFVLLASDAKLIILALTRGLGI